ncbi:MATE family efflux transporter [Bacteroidia bacterium]|nr:MATE family efflux transporter [Bacteroidia bacterium]
MQDLTQGKIFPQLARLALPIMGTGFLQLAYNITDILWLGRLNGEAVAAASAAGFLIWITFALSFVTKIGAEVSIAQAIGRKKLMWVRFLGANTIVISLILSVLVMAALFVFMQPIVGFFQLPQNISEMCMDYLSIFAVAMPMWMLVPTITGIFNGAGNSKIPFYTGCVGLTLNVVLDPLLIFGIGFFPDMGLRGAALATAISIVVECILMIILLHHKKTTPYPNFRFFAPLQRRLSLQILRMGAPAALQHSLFAFFSMTVTRIAAGVGGYVGVAVQGAGGQIESLSWTTATGVGTALGAYIGQNYGAQKMDRVIKSFTLGVTGISAVGLLIGVLFFFWGREIFAGVVPNDLNIIDAGARYLWILSLSEVFLCAEIASSGAFNGLGKSYISASVGIVFNGLRIPLALLFSRWWGLEGVWWAISISTVAKGIILTTAFPFFAHHIKKNVTFVSI